MKKVYQEPHIEIAIFDIESNMDNSNGGLGEWKDDNLDPDGWI